MSKDKRRQERLSANLFAEITNAFGNAIGRGVVVDVSLSGLAVDTEADLEPGTEVICHVEVPLALPATVVRLVDQGHMKRFGLKFKNQSIFDKFLLKKVLRGSRQTKKVSQ